MCYIPISSIPLFAEWKQNPVCSDIDDYAPAARASAAHFAPGAGAKRRGGTAPAARTRV